MLRSALPNKVEQFDPGVSLQSVNRGKLTINAICYTSVCVQTLKVSFKTVRCMGFIAWAVPLIHPQKSVLLLEKISSTKVLMPQ